MTPKPKRAKPNQQARTVKQEKAWIARIARKIWIYGERTEGRDTVRTVLECAGVIKKLPRPAKRKAGKS